MLYYPFDSDTLNYGNMINSNLTGTYEGFVAGKIGNALDFESGSSQAVWNDTLDGDDLNKIQTIDFWIKPETISSQQTPLSIWQDGTHMFKVDVLATTGLVRITLYEGGYTYEIASDSVASAGSWTHIIFLMGASNATLYINGVNENSDASTSVIPNTWTKIYIGTNEIATTFFDGLVDNIFMTDSQYTTDDVTESWNSGNGYDFSAVADTQAPYWTSNDTNFTTIATNENGLFTIQFTDADSDVDSILFSYKEDGGSWTNETPKSIGNSSSTESFAHTITSTRGQTFEWKFYANDTLGNFNESTTWSLTVANSAPQISNLWPEDDYHDNQNLTVNFTYNDVDSDSGDCYFYLNDSLDSSRAVSDTDFVEFISVNLTADGTYLWNITCEDIYGGKSSINGSFILDTINPHIYWTNPSDDNTTISNQNLTLDISCTDTNLYKLWVNVSDSLDNQIAWYNYTTTTETSLTANDYKELPSQDNYTVTTTCSDQHTAIKIDDYSVNKIGAQDKLRYDTGDNDISISLKTSDISLDYFDTEKLKDRYTFTYDFSLSTEADDTLRTYIFVLEADSPLIYLEDSEFKAHFISNKNWIDFALDDENAVYDVKKIDDYYEISITTTKTLLDFNSIGGLNIVKESAIYEYEITLPTYSDNYTNGTDLTKTGENVKFEIKWYDKYPAQYVFCYGDGSCVNESAQNYNSGELITIDKTITAVHNDVVYWQFFANDTAGNLYQTDLYSFTIANTIPPVPTSVDYVTVTAYTDTLINCSASGPNDADGEEITYYYEFRDTDNTTILQNYSPDNTFDCNTAGCDRLDTIYCYAKAHDGYDFSVKSSDYDSILIENKPPTHVTPILNSSFATNYTNENLTCYNQSTSDGDNDEIVNLFVWYKNNNPLNDLYLPFEINVNDYSGNNNNGINYNSEISSGKIGYCAEFNTTNYVEVSDNNDLDFIDEKTWELWFKRDTTGKETLFDKTNSAQNLTNYKLYFDESNYLVFTYSIPGVTAGDFEWVTSSQANFDEGSYEDTYFNTTDNAVELSAVKGNYTSKVFDATTLSSWNNISWTSNAIGELIDNKEIETKFAEGNVDMTGNVLLLHMNNNWNDASNNNEGVAYNGATFTTSSKFGSHAGIFDGSDDYVKGSDAGWPSGSNPITMSSWIKTTDNYGHVIVHGTWTNNQAIYLYVDNGKMIIGKWGGEHVGSFIVNDNKWHNVMGIWNGSKAFVYVDGKLKDSGNLTGLNIVLNEYYITTAGWPLNGIIDEVAVWNRTLSSEEVLDIYKRGILRLNLTVRDCDDSNCVGDAFDVICEDSPCDLSGLTDSQYLQYKADFLTEDGNYTPKLYNTTVHYTKYTAGLDEVSLTSSSQITDTEDFHYVAVTFDDNIATDNFNLYLDNVLEATKTEHNTSQYVDNDLLIGRDYNGINYFDGKVDEFRIYSDALSAEQIRNNYLLDYNKIISTETTRNDIWKCEITPNDGIDDGTTKDSSLTIQNYPPTAVTLLNPADNVILGALPEFNWTSSSDIDPEDTINYIIEISTDSGFSYLNYTDTLTETKDNNVALTSDEINKYYWRVNANDGSDSTPSSTRTFNYSQWNITFNVTSGEDGSALNNVNISSCTYQGFDQSGDTTNPYGPYAFPSGTWTCTFKKTLIYYDRTQSFTADDDKIVQVKLSEIFSLSIEEHTWLEALYNCIILKDCDLYDLLVQINTTTTNVWEHTRPTDESVVTSENEVSNVANSTHNITYEYTINIPNKAGYAVNTYLPLRIGYWFIDSTTGECFNQGDYPDGIELTEPYCQPLMIETIGPMGGSVSFRVDLRPSGLTAGTYNITRSIEIDPNNIWNNYGQEIIGEIEVTEDLPENIEGISTETMSVNEVKTTEVIVQQSGGGGGGSSPPVTNIYNTYIIEPEEKEDQKEEKTESKEKGLAEITGFTIGKFINGLSEGSPLIGFLIMTIIIVGGLLTYLFIRRK